MRTGSKNHIATLIAVYHLIGGIEYYRVGSRTLDYVVEHRGACRAFALLRACCVPFGLLHSSAIAGLEETKTACSSLCKAE